MTRTLKKCGPKLKIGQFISVYGEMMEIISIEKHRIGTPLENVYVYTGKKIKSGEKKKILEKEILI